MSKSASKLGHIGLEWDKSGTFKDQFQYIFFSSSRQICTILKLILKNSRFVLFEANLTQVVANSDTPETGEILPDHCISSAMSNLTSNVGQIGPKWDKCGDFFFRSDSVHFGSPGQNVPNLI